MAKISILLVAGIHNTSVAYLQVIPVRIDGRRTRIDTSGAVLERFRNETLLLNQKTD